ncbi:PREDICTED: cilia- and flagella-associated protein 70-like [Priapulus caudatus]|uniref:Cilia- and flagella-associated protein 70-like n=1 Tax=Priapulus caudatus TaxID=37621 RepID=A0ABM1EJJ0_PRICU|nr:PREDICTED: cilia- and flagella-associated protein 70-like [Priapulus caudatus]
MKRWSHITVLESFPKEKKQKEEKITSLYYCTIDLLPLLQGESTLSLCKTLLAVNGSDESTLENNQHSKPEVDVTVSVRRSPLTKEHVNCNILSVTLESCYSMPATWSPDQNLTYIISLPVPTSAEKEQGIALPGGVLYSSSENVADSRQLHWCCSSVDLGNPKAIHDRLLPAEIRECDLVDFKGEEGAVFRKAAERPRVTWNMLRRCYLDEDAASSFQAKISKGRFWPVEITRALKASLNATSTAKVKKENEDQSMYHGLIYVNLSPLLYPGVNKVRGAFRIHPYSESACCEKTKRAPLAMPAIGHGMSDEMKNSSSTINPKKLGKDAKRGASKMEIPVPEEDATLSNQVAGKEFEDANAYVVMEFSLERSLVPKSTVEELSESVSDYIKPRSPFPKVQNGAEKAVSAYQAEIIKVATIVLDEIGKIDNESGDSTGQRRLKLMHELNASGKYFTFKERLKYVIVNIVREKYFRVSIFKDKAEMQNFLSDLYVYLVDRMHNALNSVVGPESEAAPVPQFTSTILQLRHFAKEAESLNNMEAAGTYYLEIIARDKTNIGSWLNYGSFWLLAGDMTKAEECFKECLQINQSNVPSLLLTGLVHAMQEKYQAAERFFELAISVDPQNVLAWTILGLYHESIGNDIGFERAYSEANRLTSDCRHALSNGTRNDTPDKLSSQPSKDSVSTIVEGADSPDLQPDKKALPMPAQPETSIFLEAAHFLLDANVLPFAERALAKMVVAGNLGHSSDYLKLLAKLYYMKGNYKEAESVVQSALEQEFQNAELWALVGHIKQKLGDMAKAIENYERALSFAAQATADSHYLHAVYMKLGDICLSMNKFESAKHTYLLACKSSPSCYSWLGVGKACYRLI